MPHVLVIEDDVMISDIVSDALQVGGFDVDTAANGAIGIAKVHENSPCMIVLDLMMPVMDGWEFLQHYRELPGCAHTPILVMSAALPQAHKSLGVCEFLAKPFELNELLEAVERLAA